MYFSSLEVGPEHVDTAGGFFQMGLVFYAQNRIENALAFFDKVVDTWYKFLATVRNNSDELEVRLSSLSFAFDFSMDIVWTFMDIFNIRHICLVFRLLVATVLATVLKQLFHQF